MIKRLVEWLIFSVLIGLLPIIFSWLKLLVGGGAPSVIDLVSHGELLLPAASISAAAVGQLLGSDAKGRLGTLISGGCSVFILALSSLYYAVVTTAVPGVPPPDPTVVSLVSLSFYLSAVVSGGGCRIIAGSKKTQGAGHG